MDPGLEVVQVGQGGQMVCGQAKGEGFVIAELGVRQDGLEGVPEVFLGHVGLL